MLVRNGAELVVADNIFPLNPEPLISEKVLDALQSQIITGFEEALASGVPPLEALGCILDWVAAEVTRVSATPSLTRRNGSQHVALAQEPSDWSSIAAT